MAGLIGKAMAGFGTGLAQSSLIQLKTQATEGFERRMAELRASREAQSRETYGEMEQIPGAAPGTVGQRAQLSGQYTNIQQPRSPTEVYDPSSPSGTRMVADAAGMPGKGWAPTRSGDREKKILDYLFRVYDEATAMDIVDGNVDIRPDQYGDFYSIN
jgi:hypothetical protein